MFCRLFAYSPVVEVTLVSVVMDCVPAWVAVMVTSAEKEPLKSVMLVALHVNCGFEASVKTMLSVLSVGREASWNVTVPVEPTGR